MVQLDLIIPAYNEQHRIKRTLVDYLRFFDDTVRFIVVLNGCTDNTLAVVQGVQKAFPDRIQIEDITAAIGKGGAIVHGWKIANAELIGFVDADGATPPEEFKKLLEAIQTHDGVIASRFLKESTIHQRQSPLRTVVSHLSIKIIKLLFHLPYHDTQCGAKLFKAEVIRKILPHLNEHNLMFDVQLLWILHGWEYDIKEIPTVWIDQPGSAMLGAKRKFLSAAVKMFFAVVKMRLRGLPKK